MCIMEVRPGQQNVTIAQALAHNLATSKGDLEMFMEKLRAEKDFKNLELVKHEYDNVVKAYAGMLAVFGMELADHVPSHIHPHDHGNERTIVEVAHHDAKLARKFETR